MMSVLAWGVSHSRALISYALRHMWTAVQHVALNSRRNRSPTTKMVMVHHRRHGGLFLLMRRRMPSVTN